MDPRFFLPCFHGQRAPRLGHKRKEKNSVHNLPYGPRTRLIRGMYLLKILVAAKGSGIAQLRDIKNVRKRYLPKILINILTFLI